MRKYQEIIDRIKALSFDQTKMKPQRKKNFDGHRQYSQSEATAYALQNKYTLRHLFFAYAKLRGHELETPKRKELNMSLVKSLVEEYTPKEKAA